MNGSSLVSAESFIVIYHYCSSQQTNQLFQEGRDVRVSRATNKPKQKIVQKVKPGVKPTFISKRGDRKPCPKTAGGLMNNTKKFIKKPKVEFQGKVGMTRKEIREKKKAVKKAKRVESRKLKAQNKPAK